LTLLIHRALRAIPGRPKLALVVGASTTRCMPDWSSSASRAVSGGISSQPYDRAGAIASIAGGLIPVRENPVVEARHGTRLGWPRPRQPCREQRLGSDLLPPYPPCGAGFWQRPRRSARLPVLYEIPIPYRNAQKPPHAAMRDRGPGTAGNRVAKPPCGTSRQCPPERLTGLGD
jgi:hypothetical protein